jgi:hypothetical protein
MSFNNSQKQQILYYTISSLEEKFLEKYEQNIIEKVQQTLTNDSIERLEHKFIH